ncbi:hypothetical protein [Halobacterium jilantaiense]|uniref:Uncharacterized protein n=1 Tax=Halobacterium jilantaiense TaxID=355548 RepID=A0A1I0MLC7_9EURY|nr:hypothetical protein [Halobacterium jilantaiense]SEV89112.1 hypothetical protein SAMN04487945_0168 [Halobacterium jilantaiense]
MTRHTRRTALATGASTLAVLAGCGSISETSGERGDDLPEYDTATLAAAVDEREYEQPETYPGPVPQSLVDTHRSRTRELLDTVPRDPAVPNGAVSERLHRLREQTADRLPEDGARRRGLEHVDEWRHARSDAAEVAFAYLAAVGDFDRGDLTERRLDVRDDYREAGARWSYHGKDTVDALAVAKRWETALTNAGWALTPDASFPREARAAPFDAGEIAARVEAASGRLDTASGLHAAHYEDGMTDYWTTVSTAGEQLLDAAESTMAQSAQFLVRDDDATDIFERDIVNTPIYDLFRWGDTMATTNRQTAEKAARRGDYAVAAVLAGRSIVATLALSRAVDAVENGDHGVPPDVDAVLARRNAAIDAVRDARSLEPQPLAPLLSTAVHGLQFLDRRLTADPNARDIVQTVGRYAFAEYAAEVLPAVVDRVASELGVDGE